MIVKKTKCKKDILKILNDNDIYRRMASDDIYGRECTVSFEFKEYIGCYVDKKIIGLCIYRKFEGGSVVHFYVLPKFRLAYARVFAEKLLEIKFKGDLFTITPVCFRTVVNFAIKLGFENIGYHDKLFIKNGIKYKQIITRLKNE